MKRALFIFLWFAFPVRAQMSAPYNATVINLAGGETDLTNYLQIQAAAGSGGAIKFALPNSLGTNLYFLQTDGAGNLTWAAAGGGLSGLTTNGVVYATASTTVTSTAAGTTGQSLMGNTGSAPTFQTAPAGTVTALTVGTGLTGGTITTTGTVALDLTRANTWTGKQTISADVSTSGHLLTTSTIGSTANDGVGVTASSVAGSDVAGVVTMTTALHAGGGTCTITFGTTYTAAPIVILTPATTGGDVNAASMWVTSTATTFVINFGSTAAATSFKVNYIVIQPNLMHGSP